MPQRYRRIVALNYLSFLSLGLISGVLGPSLPSLARRMDIGLGMAGGLISGLSVGYLIGGLVAGAVADAFGRRPVYLTALGLTGISLLAILSAPSLAMGLLAAFFLGLGQGSIDVVVHYVGVEVGVGTWTFAFLSEKLGSGVTLASWATSGFYLALTAGRLAGSRLVGRRMADEKLVLLGVGGAVAGALLLWAAGVSAAIAPFVVAVLLMGFCFGPVYPTAMGVAQRRYAEAIGTTVGLIRPRLSPGSRAGCWRAAG
jgi:fucose permease